MGNFVKIITSGARSCTEEAKAERVALRGEEGYHVRIVL
jgi:hypothetical protein